MADSSPTPKIHKLHVERDRYFRQSVKYVDGPDYQLMLLICDTCHLIEVHCQHTSNSWNKQGTQLKCDFCGIDGT